jgi:cell division protein FtsB|tara:strand:+ start:1395 stop:1724 length:330 start_codon:yes stop_codon:yes gene_type:complete
MNVYNMVVEKIRKNKIIRFLINKYIIILAAFIVWMFFFDANVQLNKEFKKEIKELNNTINFYKKEINEDKKIITELQDSLQLEKFAREKYLMKKENEDIYIIQFDTLKK